LAKPLATRGQRHLGVWRDLRGAHLTSTSGWARLAVRASPV